MKKTGWILALILLGLSAVCFSALAESGEMSGLLSELVFMEIGQEGFYVPVPQGEGWTGGSNIGSRGQFATAQKVDEDGLAIDFQYFSQIVDRFVTEDQLADRYYDYLNFENDRDVESRDVDIDGHRARLTVFCYDNQDGTFGAHGGIILYAREMRILQIRIYAERHGYSQTQVPEITLDDLERIAGMIRFVAEEAPIRKSDTEMTIVPAEGEALVVPSGKSIQLKAVFGNEEVVNSKNKNSDVSWAVSDPLTGGESLQAKISEGGMLSVVKGIDQVTEVQVTVTSVAYGTVADAMVKVLPPVTEIHVVPDKVTYYANSGEETLLTASLLPDTVPLIGLVWSAEGKGKVEITDHQNGTAVIRPAKAGKCVVTVREPGGKTDKVSVTILQPVTEIRLSMKGKMYPGTNVSCQAVVLPKNASDNSIRWAIESGEKYATITPRGTVKINKDAPVGEKIIVSCTAEGAPDPLVERLEITVTEKPSKDRKEEKEQPTETPEASKQPEESAADKPETSQNPEETATETPEASPKPEETATETPEASPKPEETATEAPEASQKPEEADTDRPTNRPVTSETPAPSEEDDEPAAG